ncbi:hypothetical protein [Psychromonas sp. GE-S-Ul-11]|jgi:hypothetical protein|uniref:hypothetical protein n=1 Tax=Psychromonas sp. GE-S-Ul-11 TaxID=3241170 RepID=UPI00390CB316
MFTKLKLNNEKINELNSLLKIADKKSKDFRQIVFELDPKNKILKLVAGNSLQMSSLTLTKINIESNDTEKCFFSFDADIMIEALFGVVDNFDIYLKKDCLETIEMSFPGLPRFRRGYSDQPNQDFLNYLSNSYELTDKKYNRTALLDLVQLVNEKFSPFESVLLKSDENNTDSVKVLRDGEVFEQNLGTNSHLDVELFLDKNTINAVVGACQNSSDDEIGIEIENDRITLQSNDRKTSISLPDYSDLLSKVEIQKEVVFSAVLDAYKLKLELSNYIKINNIKQQEQSFLFFDSGKLLVCAITEKLECADLLELIDVSTNQKTLVLMVNLHLFKALKVKDVTDFHQLKISITRVNGEYFFSFFNRSDFRHPFFSVPCISVPERVDEVNRLSQKLQIQIADQNKSSVKNQQIDLVGYDELLDL